jgi:aminoglycoside 2'-N-acetyltransferase I
VVAGAHAGDPQLTNGPPAFAIAVVRSSDLGAQELDAVRALVEAGFPGDFSADDWAHTVGGWHVLARDDALIGHAAVVERTLYVDRRPIRTGYVESVATALARRRRGVGSAVMSRAGELIRSRFELGALSTSLPDFYARFGWERWGGPSFVRGGDAVVRTPDEDGGIMVLRCGPSATVELDLPIMCEARSGDDW